MVVLLFILILIESELEISFLIAYTSTPCLKTNPKKLKVNG